MHMIIEAYHGTDLVNAKRIVATDYIYKQSETHWLGNGVYFYIDLSLAKWWTSNPSKIYGVRVSNPAIIKTIIDIPDDESFLDLRKLSDYKEFSNIFFYEYLPLLKMGSLTFNLANHKKLRCSFCDYLKVKYNLKLIIGNFSLPKQPYLTNYKSLASQLELFYIETQMCLFDTKYIIKKELIV